MGNGTLNNFSEQPVGATVAARMPSSGWRRLAAAEPIATKPAPGAPAEETALHIPATGRA
jgi:hypothetical protein